MLSCLKKKLKIIAFELLNSYINKKLVEGKIQSFVLEGEMSDLINVTLLKFDDWIRIVSSDEITSVDIQDKSFENITNYGDDDYYYPINPLEFYFPEVKKYYGKTIRMERTCIS